jgi:uncharacterized protein with PQ loop repeat
MFRAFLQPGDAAIFLFFLPQCISKIIKVKNNKKIDRFMAESISQ